MSNTTYRLASVSIKRIIFGAFYLFRKTISLLLELLSEIILLWWRACIVGFFAGLVLFCLIFGSWGVLVTATSCQPQMVYIIQQLHKMHPTFDPIPLGSPHADPNAPIDPYE